MQGRLYEASASIYDDEARILFDYFSKAADDIIKKEDEVQAKIDGAKEQLAKQEKARRGTWIKSLVFLVLAIALCVYCAIDFGLTTTYTYVSFGIIAIVLIAGLVACNGAKGKVASRKAELASCEKEYADIRREYKVSRLGVAYVPIAKKVPFGNQNVTVDLSSRRFSPPSLS